MRYSMLVYMSKMGKTLLEAAQYLRTAPEDALRAEIVESGRQMLAQIREVLEGHRDDLHSEAPLVQLSEIEGSWEGVGEGLESQLEQFVQSLPEQVSYQVRAVFFAELGEKWDAMESVYEFMRDDPRFDPVVVRTPVGRVVERDGKREQEIIYKDFLTPMGVPSLDYDQYNIEEDCPELAFISQPYESCTLEQFWPEYITKHSRLVYANYGVLGPVFEDSALPLCKLPVYRYAWKVLGASERHYRYYRKYAENGGGNMLVTGIPKFDPIVRLNTHPLTVPESWEPALHGRRIILWNTWYDPSRSSFSYFDEIVDWLQVHDDCAVIWRPHPMMDTVTKLYYPPEVYVKLQKNIERAKNTPNMVYDEQVSYETAFSCSNAMISDYSSLMFQYLLLDKPTLWMKHKGVYGPFDGRMLDNEYIIDWRWMEEAESIEGVLDFLERSRKGLDQKADIRRKMLQRDLPLADGRCGERICDALWDIMHREDLRQ